MKVTTEFPFPVSMRAKFIFPFPPHHHASNSHFIKHFLSSSLVRCCLSSNNNDNNNSNSTNTSTSTSSSSGWVNNWKSNPNIKPHSISAGPQVTTTTAIDRIVLRLRNLGLPSSDDEDIIENPQVVTADDDEKLVDLLKRDWVRPDRILIQEEEEEDSVLPWEKEEYRQQQQGEGGMSNNGQVKKGMKKAPTLAELTLEDSELRRLRTVGTSMRERITIPKAGITESVLQNIHDHWRKSELVRLKFHEVLARDMKTAHHIVQRRTGGLVIWQSGSVMMVYRGVNYAGPSSRSQSTENPSDTLFVPDVSSANNNNIVTRNDDVAATSPATRTPVLADRTMTEEETEFNSVLDGLGPRFQEWWGTGILPVDADLLPQTVSGFKTPFRLLPTGMRSKLTNAEMTNLRKLAKSLPCHFALGRNRNHQGLAAAIIKLWEKSMVAKIAVKRGIQNTNNELMAEELKVVHSSVTNHKAQRVSLHLSTEKMKLTEVCRKFTGPEIRIYRKFIKRLTGGVLLLRNKYYIVIYRGKDFVPRSVATALAERQEMTKEIQDAEEKLRNRVVEVAAGASVENGQAALAGSLAEFYEAQAQWGREKTSEEHEIMIKEASKTKVTRVVKKLEHKLFIAQSKRLKADKELAKIRESWFPAGAPEDQETITDEERVMFRRVGLRMKPYLPLGIRGVFDGVIENMHLHWKHRELVKLISKQKDIEFVEETARFLEDESGGILIDIVRVPKGYAIMYYRGKNYQRPISIRPRSLPSKARALKRWKALQRYEALTEHVTELENTIKQIKKENGGFDDIMDMSAQNSEEIELHDHVSESILGDDESSWENSDDEVDADQDEDEDSDWENDEQL